LDERLCESGKDDHAAEAMADDHQERVSAALLLAVAIMAQPPEQFPDGTHRHALSGRLPGPESCVGDDVAQAEIRQAAPGDEDAKDRTGRDAGGRVLFLVPDRLAQKRAERGQIVVVGAGVVLPTVHEDDKDHVLPRLRIVRRERLQPLGDAVHLPSVVTAPLIVKLDDGEFVRSAGHESGKRLMLLVGHDPKGLSRLDWRQTLQTVIHDGASPDGFGNRAACIPCQRNCESTSRKRRGAK
jgi:hypothetical protein